MDSQIASTATFADAVRERGWRRLEASHWFTLLAFAIAIIVFLDAPILAMYYAGKPFPGFVVEQSLVVADITGDGWSGRQSGLGFPQRVTHIGDQQVATEDEFNEVLSSFIPGEYIEVHTLLPDGTRRTYPSIAVSQFTSSDLFRLFWLPYGVGLIYLIIGLWVYQLRGKTGPARAFAYFCANTAMVIGLLFDLITTHAGAAIWTIAIAQVGGAFISLGLLFPEEWPIVKRHSWLRFTPYGISVLLSIYGLVVLGNPLDPWAYAVAWRYSYIYAAIGILAFLAINLYRLYTNPSAVARQQARIILWGSFLAFSPVAVWLSASLFGVSMIWNPGYFLPFMLIFPLSIAVAIVRYRLWEIGVIINRTLVYAILSFLLIGVYFISVMVFEQMLRQFAGQNSRLAAAISTLAIAALFSPMRQRVQDFIDQRFYRRKYDAVKTLAAFSETLRDEVDLGNLIERLELIIWETLQPQHVLSWLETPSGFHIYNFKGEFFPETKSEILTVNGPVAFQDPIVTYLRGAPGAVDLYRLDMDSPALFNLKAAGIKVIVPLIGQGQLVGYLSLGPRLSEREYSSDDRLLLTQLAVQVAPAVRVAQLVRQREQEALERERLEHELRIARLIQHTLLPKQLPELADWQVAAHYQPARAVGGDFYDFISFEDGRLGIFIGDVTDKGIPAALVMSMTLTMIRTVARQTDSPGEVLRQVNNLLESGIPAGMFVTCLYALVDTHTGRLRFANAGHNLPYRKSADGVCEMRATGMPLGLMPDMEYEEAEVAVRPGECVVFYSDGLVEAHNREREMFGTKRLQALIGQGIDDSSAMIKHLLRELSSFSGPGWEQEDDVTLVALIHRSLPENLPEEKDASTSIGAPVP